MPRKLTAKQALFLACYLECGNASAAYCTAYGAAGVGPRKAASRTWRLLQQPQIARAVTEHRAAEAARATKLMMARDIPAADLLLERYARIAFFDIGTVARWDEQGKPLLAEGETLAAAVRAGLVSVAVERESGGVTISTAGKLAALDRLAKLLGLFDGSPRARPQGSPLTIGISE